MAKMDLTSFPSDELERLLDDVHRIAEGVGDMRALVVEVARRPGPARIVVASDPPNRAMREASDAYARASASGESNVTISRVTLLGLLVAAHIFGEVS